MEIHFKLIGIILMILGFIHVIFPKYFNWKNELIQLSQINRQMMIVHTFFIALTVFMMGLLCFQFAEELIHTKLGKAITFGLAIFWGLRLFIQLFGYSKELWKGKRFETVVHYVFTMIWTYLSVVFLMSSFPSLLFIS